MRVSRAFLGTVVLLAGCATGPESDDEPATIRAASMAEPPEEITGNWRVQGVIDAQGRYLEPDGAPFTMEIGSNGDAAGLAACNNWNGNVEHVDETHLRMGAIGFTRQACPLDDQDAQLFERTFVTDLTRTMEWSRSSDTLTLRFQDGQEWELARPDD